MSSQLSGSYGGVDRRRRTRSRFDAPVDVLYGLLRLIARHVRGFWAAILAFLAIALSLGLLATALFGVLAEAVRGGFTQSVDERVLRWFEARRTPGLDEAMLEITAIGSGIPLILMVIVAVVFLWVSRHHWSVYFLLLGTLGGQLLNRLLKGYFDRDRPSVVEWGHYVDTASFPSGHAMSSFVVYGSIAYLVARLAPSKTLKRFTWGFAALMILAVGITRMYLGVHYPTDVIGGFLAGLAWVTFVAASMAALRFFAPRRPETRTEERDLEATSLPRDPA
jgi:undecaprenyl-diphosphatase